MPLSHPDDRIYEAWGVTPPERQAHGTEADIAAEINRPLQHGQWKQNGNLITCNRCPMPHSTAVPMDYLLIGTDEKGLPILNKLDIPKS